MKAEEAKPGPRPKKKDGYTKWIIQVFVMSILLSAGMTAASDVALSGANMAVALVVLGVLIFINFAFDVIGVSVLSTDPAPFVAMASKRVRGAKHSIFILQNAEKVSNICCDIVGDICGIVSGAAGASVVVMLTRFDYWSLAVWSVIVSSLISGLTISLKAYSKKLAAKHCKEIVRLSGYAISFIPVK